MNERWVKAVHVVLPEVAEERLLHSGTGFAAFYGQRRNPSSPLSTRTRAPVVDEKWTIW